MISRFQQFGLRLNGYKKVMLNDTKDVLTSANNFKFVKAESHIIDVKRTVLPSGTKVLEMEDADTYVKDVIKSDGTVFHYIRNKIFDSWSLKKDDRIIRGHAFGKDYSPSEIRFLNNRKRHI